MERSSSSSYVPHDLLEDILIRLPAKSIIRFKCVKKSWYTLLQNPTFIAKHHSFQSQNNPNLLVQSESENLTPPTITLFQNPSFMSLHPHCHNDGFDSEVSLGMPIFRDKWKTFMNPNLCACINGIICLHEDNYPGRIVLLNPAIRQCKYICLPKFPSSPARGLFAFGYDQNSNDYKVVRIVSYNSHSIRGGNIDKIPHPVIQVYTLSTDSFREIDTPNFDRSNVYSLQHSNEIYVNGVHYWRGMFKDERRRTCEGIVSFDMRDEMFRTTKMPDLGDYISHRKTLSVVNNCLALIIYDMQHKEKIFDIWVMNDNGIDKSWTKQFVIGPLFVTRTTREFLVLNGRILLVGDKLVLVSGEGQILLYNFSAQETKNLQLQNLPNKVSVSRAMVYVESLVSITGGNVY
jgi:F-box interacting protein